MDEIRYPGDKYVSELREASDFIGTRLKQSPAIGIVLGSGLGGLADKLSDAVSIPYSEIPNFPISTVPGHAGKFVAGTLGGKYVACLKGRVHGYEGYPGCRIAFGVRSLGLLGVKNLFVSNAAGGIREDLQPGSLMCLSNIIGFNSENPSVGVYHPSLGELFYDVSFPFDAGFEEILKGSYEAAGVTFVKGIYMLTRGPNYETAAEIQAAKSLGADAVGMSTVPEVLAARQMGMRVAGISLISNLAAGISKSPLNHREVMEIGEKAGEKFQEIVENFIAVAELK